MLSWWPAVLSAHTPAATEGRSTGSTTTTACRADPLAGRPLYLRGSFNGWTVDEAHRLRWSCDHWQAVLGLQGEHRFKAGDESWSPDADFGRPLSSPSSPTSPALATGGQALALRGGDLVHRFAGQHRFKLRPAQAGQPARLAIETCPAPSLGDTDLFLRGDFNQWAAAEAQRFSWTCDAYWLNLDHRGTITAVVADAGWRRDAGAPPVGGQHRLALNGPQSLRLTFDAQRRPSLAVGPPSVADPRPPQVTDPVAMSLRFDSRDAVHKSPFGAVPVGTAVELAVHALPGVDAVALVVEQRTLEGNQERLQYRRWLRLPMQREPLAAAADAPSAPSSLSAPPAAGTERWVARFTPTEVAVHGYWFEARIGGKVYVLHNNDRAVPWTREKGSGGAGVVALAPEGAVPEAGGPDNGRTPSASVLRRFRLSAYRADFRVPDWAPDAVFYQVFPERFRNGDKTNDPQPGTRRYQTHGIEKHPRWLGTPYRPGSGDGSDAVFNNDFFGGDLAGLIDKLDHLQRLGVNALYLTPVFLAASNHKYDTADYHRIDPAFGSQADFERLTREAAQRGLRVVVDASLNHTGSDSLYFDRYGNFASADGSGSRRSSGAFAFGRINPDSPYAGWYSFDARQTDPDQQYQGWTGVATLPELNKQSAGWRDFAYRAPDSVTRRWLRAGASGWRMDVAPWVSDDFWREWRGVVKATRPDALTIAETWFDPAKHLLGDMFDSSMNYVFRNAVLDWANGGPATTLAAVLEHLREQVPPPAHAALMNLLSSHDVPRALHVLGDTGTNAGPAARALARQRLRLALVLQMSYPGAPSVYYGDEVGLTGGDDPYNRAPYPWADEGGQPDAALEGDYRALIALRHAQPVLRRGALAAPLHADDAVLVLARRLDGAAPPQAARFAVTAFNNAAAPRRVSVVLPDGWPNGPFRDAQTGAAPADGVHAQQRRLTIDLPAHGALLLLAD